MAKKAAKKAKPTKKSSKSSKTAKAKNRRKRPAPRAASRGISVWDEQMKALPGSSEEVRAGRAGVALTDEEVNPTRSRAAYTPEELGAPEADDRETIVNPQGAQGGRGPLSQEGEGNRQNDELAELEQDIDAEADLERRR